MSIIYLKTWRAWIKDHIKAAEEEMNIFINKFITKTAIIVYLTPFPPDFAEFFSAKDY